MKYKVLVRDDSNGNQVVYKEAVIEVKSIEELLGHAHIVEILGEVVEEKAKVTKKEVKK